MALDELKPTNPTISAAAINSGLIAALPLQEGSGTVLTELVSGANATLSADQWAVDSVLGDVVDFDSVAGWIDTGWTGGAFDTDEYTLSMILKVPAIGDFGGATSGADLGFSGTVGWWMRSTSEASSTPRRWMLRGAGGVDTWSSQFSDSHNDSFIVLTFTGSVANGRRRVFVNGVQLGGDIGAPVAAAWGSIGGSVTIGRALNPLVGSQIADVRMWNVEKNPADVLSLFEAPFASYDAGVNSPPVANAGPDQSTSVGSLVTLDGTSSSDANSDSLSYAWTQIGTPAVALSDATAAQPTFTAPGTSETLVFSLMVHDGTENAASADTVTVSVGATAVLGAELQVSASTESMAGPSGGPFSTISYTVENHSGGDFVWKAAHSPLVTLSKSIGTLQNEESETITATIDPTLADGDHNGCVQFAVLHLPVALVVKRFHILVGTRPAQVEATYYIDHENGDDTANGTTDQTPWQHCPGDPNATNNTDGPLAKTPAAGERYLFKGGVSYRGQINFDSSWGGTSLNPIVMDGNTRNEFGTGPAIIDGAVAPPAAIDWTNEGGGVFSAAIPAGYSLDDVNLCAGDRQMVLSQGPVKPTDPLQYHSLEQMQSIPQADLAEELARGGDIYFSATNTISSTTTDLSALLAGTTVIISGSERTYSAQDVIDGDYHTAGTFSNDGTYTVSSSSANTITLNESTLTVLPAGPQLLKVADDDPVGTIVDTRFSALTAANASWWVDAKVALWVQGNLVNDYPILSVSGDEVTYEATNALPTYKDRDGYYAIINSPAYLQTAGDYYVDPTNNRVFCIPFDSADITNAVITFSDNSRSVGFYLSDSSYVTINGFRVLRHSTAASSGGVGFSKTSSTYTSEIKVHNCEFAISRANRNNGAGASGAVSWSRETLNSEFIGNAVHQTINTRGVNIGGSVQNTTGMNCSNNIIHRTGGSGILSQSNDNCTMDSNVIMNLRAAHANGIAIYQDTTSPTISNSFIAGGLIPITIQDCTGALIRNNILASYSDGSAAISGWNGSLVGTNNLSILNNVLLVPLYSVAMTFSDTGQGEDGITYTGNVIRNNVVDQNLPTAISGRLAIDHNIFIDPEASDGSTGSSSEVLNDLFADAANWDYSPKAAGPLVDSGVDVGLPYQGAAPDIGAEEVATDIAVTVDAPAAGSAVANNPSAGLTAPGTLAATVDAPAAGSAATNDPSAALFHPGFVAATVDAAAAGSATANNPSATLTSNEITATLDALTLNAQAGTVEARVGDPPAIAGIGAVNLLGSQPVSTWDDNVREALTMLASNFLSDDVTGPVAGQFMLSDDSEQAMSQRNRFNSKWFKLWGLGAGKPRWWCDLAGAELSLEAPAAFTEAYGLIFPAAPGALGEAMRVATIADGKRQLEWFVPGAGGSTLSTLSDVDLTGRSDGMVLEWDSTSGSYLHVTPSAGGGGSSDLDGLTDTTITAAASGDFLRYNGTAWVDSVLLEGDIPALSAYAAAAHNHDGSYSALGHDHSGVYSPVGHTHSYLADTAGLTDLTGVTIIAAASGEFLRHNGTAWVDSVLLEGDIPALSAYAAAAHNHDGDYSAIGHDHSGVYSPVGHTHSYLADTAGLTDLAGVVISTPSSGQVLKYNGTNWVNGADELGGGSASIAALTDTTITAAASGEFLRHNGTAWVDSVLLEGDIPALSAYAAASHNHDADYAALATFNGHAADVTLHFTKASIQVADLGDTDFTAPASGDFMRHNGSDWVDSTLLESDIPALSAYAAAAHNHHADYSALGHDHSGVYSPVGHSHSYLADTAGLTDLAGVTITAAASGEFLRHNGTAWVDSVLLESDIPALSAYAAAAHNHDADYSAISHNHSGVYSPVGHSHSYLADTAGLTDLAGVTITAAASGEFLRHNGTAWVDSVLLESDIPALSAYAAAAHNHNGEYSLLAHEHDADYADLAVYNAHAVDTSLHFTKSSISISDLGDTTITAAADGDFLRHNGTAWVDSVLLEGDIPALSAYAAASHNHDGDYLAVSSGDVSAATTFTGGLLAGPGAPFDLFNGIFKHGFTRTATADRTHTLQNASGTLAHLSDLSDNTLDATNVDLTGVDLGALLYHDGDEIIQLGSGLENQVPTANLDGSLTYQDQQGKARAIPVNVPPSALEAGAYTRLIARAPVSGTVTRVSAKITGAGSTIDVQFRIAGSVNVLTTGLDVSTPGTWIETSTIANAAITANQDIEILLSGATGTLTEIFAQLHFDEA